LWENVINYAMGIRAEPSKKKGLTVFVNPFDYLVELARIELAAS
jgi:hypothetical protein